MAGMATIKDLPVEIFDVMVEFFVFQVGIQKAVLLRSVDRSFDVTILRAICVTQIVDIGDAATKNLERRLHPLLNGRILAAKSRCAGASASIGNIEMTKFLIEQGADVNLNGLLLRDHLPIEGAAFHGQEDVVNLLIAHGADPRYALQSAIKGGQSRLVRCLIHSHPDLLHRENGWVAREALAGAVASRNLRPITFLVEAGVSLDEGWGYDNDGMGWELPICMAKQGGLPWMVDHLTALGARDTDDEMDAQEFLVDARGINVPERTWDWVGKY